MSKSQEFGTPAQTKERSEKASKPIVYFSWRGQTVLAVQEEVNNEFGHSVISLADSITLQDDEVLPKGTKIRVSNNEISATKPEKIKRVKAPKEKQRTGWSWDKH